MPISYRDSLRLVWRGLHPALGKAILFEVKMFSEKDIKRFWSKVDVRGENECWNWKAGLGQDGYGQFWIKPRSHPSHRVAWTIANGRSPRDGYEIAHAPVICHNRLCCNPSHLSEKTRKENAADAKIDGTQVYIGGEQNGHSKLTESDVKTIRILRKQGVFQRVVAAMFGTSQPNISSIEHGKSWKR